jgi:hypothetical protein
MTLTKLIVTSSVLLSSAGAFGVRNTSKMEYAYKIDTSEITKLSESCSYKGVRRSSVIKVLGLEDKSSKGELVQLGVRMSICPIIGELIRVGINIPIPKALIEDLSRVLSQKSTTIRFESRPLFAGDSGKQDGVQFDAIVLTPGRQSNDTSEITLNFLSNGKPIEKIGALKLSFANKAFGQTIRGFDLEKSIPLKSISVELLQQKLLLNSELYKIESTDE